MAPEVDQSRFGLGTPAHVSLQCHLISDRRYHRLDGEGGWLLADEAEALPAQIAEEHGAELHEGELHLMTQQHRVRIRWHRYAHAIVTETLLSPLKASRIEDWEKELPRMAMRHEAVIDVLLKSMPRAWHREELMVIPPLAKSADSLVALPTLAKLLGGVAAGQIAPEVLHAHGLRESGAGRISARRGLLLLIKTTFNVTEPLPGRIVEDFIGRTSLEGLYEVSESQSEDIQHHSDRLRMLAEELPPALRAGGDALSAVLTDALTTLAQLASELYPLRAIFQRYTSRVEQITTDLGAMRAVWSQPYGLGMQVLGEDGRRMLERSRRSVDRNLEAVVRLVSQLEGLQALIQGALEVEQGKRHMRLQQTIQQNVLQNTKLVETLDVLLAQEEQRTTLELRQVRGLKLVTIVLVFHVVFIVTWGAFSLFYEGSGGICTPSDHEHCDNPLAVEDILALIRLSVLVAIPAIVMGTIVLFCFLLTGTVTGRRDKRRMADTRESAHSALEKMIDEATRS